MHYNDYIISHIDHFLSMYSIQTHLFVLDEKSEDWIIIFCVS